MRYYVEFEINGVKRFGTIVGKYDAEAKKAAKDGCVILEDAILPKRYKLSTRTPLTDIDMEDAWTRIETECQRAMERSNKIKGCKPGKVFQLPRGDGSSYYVVTAVKGKTVSVEWRGFSADRWVDLMLGYGRDMPKDTITPFIY